MRKLSTAAGVLLGVGLLSLGPPTQGAEKTAGFRIVVHSSNPTTSLTLAEVSQFFLKRTTRWSSGTPIQPVDLPTSSPVREGFSRKVLGRSAVAIEAFWNKQIFSGQGTPPLIKSSDREVMAYVKDNAGAIAYVGTDTPLDSGVKVVSLTEK